MTGIDSLENAEQGDRDNEQRDSEVEDTNLLGHHYASVAVKSVPSGKFLPLSFTRFFPVVTRIRE